jgi:hypothetical protein
VSFATAYGLTLRSNQPIPGALPRDDRARADADLTITFAQAPDWAALAHANEPGDGRHYLAYPDDTRFYIDLGARSIWATWRGPLTLEDTATYLLGPVLGLYLRLLGHACLHGSAVLIGERCHVFVGPAGSGKSTLAAAFAGLGVPVLTEDVACIDEASGALAVRPGYPRIRLWEDSARLLAAVGSDLPLLTPNWEKRFLELGSMKAPFASAPAPIAAVHVLEPRRAMAAPAALTPYTGQDALTRLLANTYGKRLVDRGMRAREFAVLGRLAQAVPVRGLTLADDGARLPEACEWIRTHALA